MIDVTEHLVATARDAAVAANGVQMIRDDFRTFTTKIDAVLAGQEARLAKIDSKVTRLNTLVSVASALAGALGYKVFGVIGSSG